MMNYTGDINMAFNVVRHPVFVAVVRAILLARFVYEPPSYHIMRASFIEPTKKHVEIEVKKAMKQSIEIYVATICTDGWDNVIRQPLMNVMLSCPTCDVFLGSIHTTRNKNMKACIATELKKFIDEVGPSFVTQICMDNGMNMLLAIDDIVTTYLHVFKQNCAGHTLDLMLDD
jgi:hypothetical protein